MTTVLALVLAISLPAGLEAKAKTAFNDIQKAKALLDNGNSKASQSWLTRGQTALKSIMGTQAPAAQKAQDAQKEAQQGNTQQATNALSAAEQEAAKLDPSLAQKVGVAKNQTAQGDSGGAAASVKNELAQKLGVGGLADVYDKVSQARSLLKGGNTTQAKSLLDEIPSNASSFLSLLGH